MGGRPPIAPEVRELIRTMSRDNDGWGAPRIHGELLLLGIHVSQATVAKYMVGRVEDWRGNPLGEPLSVSGVSSYVPG